MLFRSRKVNGIGSVRFQRIKQVHLYPFSGSLDFGLLYLRWGNDYFLRRLLQFDKLVKLKRNLSSLAIHRTGWRITADETGRVKIPRSTFRSSNAGTRIEHDHQRYYRKGPANDLLYLLILKL